MPGGTSLDVDPADIPAARRVVRFPVDDVPCHAPQIALYAGALQQGSHLVGISSDGMSPGGGFLRDPFLKPGDAADYQKIHVRLARTYNMALFDNDLKGTTRRNRYTAPTSRVRALGVGIRPAVSSSEGWRRGRRRCGLKIIGNPYGEENGDSVILVVACGP
jgi:hypothetical protein